ncbi:MAG: YgiT-type zinc finger protein [Candidatus Altiarchaeota archaeon]|nr:YgiT-type zinc finger protein [Candidatus Altiarchaeota archaeon]
MKCVICGGEVIRKKVEEKIVVGNDVFLFDIVTDTCMSCGERYYSDALMDKLARLKKKLTRPIKGAISVGHVYNVPQPI